MFKKRDYVCFTISAICAASGFGLMAADPVNNGFGILTLWIATPLLVTAFFLPFWGISDAMDGSSLVGKFRQHPVLHGGGLLAFGCAFVIYLLTLEATASLWDCSEFIASAYKLQVPHTPGTPLALLIGRLFTMISFGEHRKLPGVLT